MLNQKAQTPKQERRNFFSVGTPGAYMPMSPDPNGINHTLNKTGIIIRLDQPVVGIPFKPHLLIRSNTSYVSKSETFIRFEYFKSKLKRKNNCYNFSCKSVQPVDINTAASSPRSEPSNSFSLNNGDPINNTIECIFTQRRYCSNSCFKKDWKRLFSSERLGLKCSTASISNKLSEAEVEKLNKSNNSEYFKNLYMERQQENQEDILWISVSSNDAYIPTEEDVGHVLKVKCTATYEEEVFSLEPTNETKTRQITGESKLSAPVMQLPFDPVKRTMKKLTGKSLQEALTAKISILSYNILADIYTNKKGYPYSPECLLNWKVRRKILEFQILEHQPDIICLQEVQHNEYVSFFKPYFEYKNPYSVSYQTVYKMKTRDSLEETKLRPSHRIDGCLTAYKASKFKEIDVEFIEFNKLATAAFRNSSEHLDVVKEKIKRLEHDNIGIILLLQSKKTHGFVCVVHTHLHWDPEYADVKLWQAMQLVDEVEKFRKKVCSRYNLTLSSLPILIAGDFNSTEDDHTIAFLKQSLKDLKKELPDPLAILPKAPNGSSILKHNLNLSSCYESATEKEPEFTNWAASFKGTLDYVFATRERIKVTKCLIMPSEEEVKGEWGTPLPNFHNPSDHLPLFFEVGVSYLTAENNGGRSVLPQVTPFIPFTSAATGGNDFLREYYKNLRPNPLE
eukprot:maker-scaffold_1-snap-gene-22.59-mRNA-1 protein AED:0.06 eAED:0.06 QI:309/1/1/1/1/1/3/154/678